MSEGVAALDFFGVVWRLGATLFFVLLNALFVAAEFALVKARATRIETLAAEGSRRAAALHHVLSHLDRYLSACQLGITLASLALGALGEPAVSVLLLAAARGMGFELSPTSPALPIVSIVLAFTVITSLHMTLGEQAPKMWALRYAESTALRTAWLLRIFTFVFGPFIVALNGISNALLRLAGVPPGEIHEPGHSAEEIRSILWLSARTGEISERELEITENVFRLIEKEVRHILVPRADVDFLSLERDLDDNLRILRESGHSRFPLCEFGLDTIVGFVHAKDVLDTVLRGEVLDLRRLAREQLFVPDTMSLANFLRELQQKQHHYASVVDEHGTVTGLAFREDALEEIVGPLGDEFDQKERELVKVDENTYEVNGRVSLPEICDRLDFELADDEYEDQDTIGGHVTARLGRLPVRGDSTSVGPWRATVLEVGRRRVKRLRLERLPEPTSEAPEEAAS
ncbi:MAG TPA: hemolysin family protein [Myxococcota bacterium]|nr:hemolysin family protein [Myxococcota bacterium]